MGWSFFLFAPRQGWEKEEENTSEQTMARHGEQKQDVDTLPTSKGADHCGGKDHFV